MFDLRVRTKVQIVHCRTYAHSYHVFKFQGSSAYSVGGDIGQDGQTDRQTDRRKDGRTAEITTISNFVHIHNGIKANLCLLGLNISIP